MQLQFRSEFKKYISSQKSGDPRSNRLLGEMVKRGVIDAQAKQQLQEMEARRNGHVSGCGKLKTGKSCCNKENTPQSGPLPNMGSANIDKIIQFIEGGPQNEAAFKKAQKKARQKQKKDEERRQREEEEEAQRRAEEERLRRERQLLEQQRIKEELALQKQLKKKKKQPTPVAPPANDSKSKKKKGKEPQVVHCVPDPQPEFSEQTIPAMVTIKRIVENNNSPPTVTITLKGSTPDQDKLLYTLVNGHDAPIISHQPCATGDKSQQNKQVHIQGNSVQKPDNSKTGKKKKNGGGAANNTNSASSATLANSSKNSKNKENVQVQTSEIKVQLSIDSSFRKDVAKAKEKQAKDLQAQKQKVQQPQQQPVNSKGKKQEERKSTSTKEVKKPAKGTNSSNSCSTSTSSLSSPEVIDIPSIKLPPGITITKVSGPVANRKSSAALANDYPDVPVSKSGVIVVDTEKLIQQQASATGKKKKKKAKKAAAEQASQNGGVSVTKSEPRVLIQSASTNAAVLKPIGAPSAGGIVTLKNPIFHPISKAPPGGGEMPHMMSMTDQATISHGENGMVTIRRHRPVGFMPTNESPLSEYLAKTADVTTTASAGAETASAVVVTAAPPTDAATVVTHSLSAIATTTSSTQTLATSATSSTTSNPPILTPWQMPDTSFSVLSEERKIIRPPSLRGVQWPRAESENGSKTPGVLQGLPGIQITRVPTGAPAVEEYVEPPANVSIIRTGGCHVSDSPQSWAYPAQP